MRTCRTSSHHLHPPTRVSRSAVSRLNLVYPSEQIGWVVRVLTNGHDIHVHTRSLLRIYSPVCVCWFACCVTVDLRSGLFFFVYSLPSISLRLPPSPPFLADFHDDFFLVHFFHYQISLPFGCKEYTCARCIVFFPFFSSQGPHVRKLYVNFLLRKPVRKLKKFFKLQRV